MILQALYQYYEAMLKAERIAAPGLEEKPIRWIIVIKEDGSFVRIEDRKDYNDKKSKGQNFLVFQEIIKCRCMSKRSIFGYRSIFSLFFTVG